MATIHPELFSVDTRGWQPEVYNPNNFMQDANALNNYYRSLTDQELLNRGSQDGFTDKAEQVLRKELARRNLGTADIKRFIAASEHSKLRDEVIERGGGYRGFGLQFFGKSYLNETDKKANIQVRTKWFTMSGIPLFPIASYRFKCTGNPGKQKVLDRVPFNWAQISMTWIKASTLLVGAALLVIGFYWYLDRGKH